MRTTLITREECISNLRQAFSVVSIQVSDSQVTKIAKAFEENGFLQEPLDLRGMGHVPSDEVKQKMENARTILNRLVSVGSIFRLANISAKKSQVVAFCDYLGSDSVSILKPERKIRAKPYIS